MRKVIRNTILSLFGSLLKPKPGIHIINSHYVARKMPSAEQYNAFLKQLNKYSEFIRFENATRLINEKKIPKKDVLISFSIDDGFEECYTIIAPALEEQKTNGAFFINGGFITGNKQYKDNFTKNIVHTPYKQPMTADQIYDLHNRGHIIGSHTFDHFNMNSNNPLVIEEQVVKNKLWIERITEIQCDYFAWPYGTLSHINNLSIDIIMRYHKYVYSDTNYKKYFSMNGKAINRRHIEPFWPKSHIKYFLSCNKRFNL